MSIEEVLLSIRDGIERNNELLEKVLAKPSEGLVTLQEAASALKLHYNTIYRRCQSGEYQSYRDGKILRVDVSEIRLKMKKQSNGALSHE